MLPYMLWFNSRTKNYIQKFMYYHLILDNLCRKFTRCIGFYFSKITDVVVLKRSK